jgi:hypothetical protein
MVRVVIFPAEAHGIGVLDSEMGTGNISMARIVIFRSELYDTSKGNAKILANL